MWLNNWFVQAPIPTKKLFASSHRYSQADALKYVGIEREVDMT